MHIRPPSKPHVKAARSGTVIVALLLAAGTTPTHAKHLSESEVVSLERQCMAAEAPIIDRVRQRKLLECQQHERQNRGDPKTCVEYVKDIQPGGHVIIDPPFPVCEQAFQARQHYGLYPR
jgi:hypothetical protein